MTAVLERLDNRVAEAVPDVGPGEIVGWLLIGVGAVTAVLSGGVVGALYFWGDLLTVGDLW